MSYISWFCHAYSKQTNQPTKPETSRNQSTKQLRCVLSSSGPHLPYNALLINHHHQVTTRSLPPMTRPQLRACHWGQQNPSIPQPAAASDQAPHLATTTFELRRSDRSASGDFSPGEHHPLVLVTTRLFCLLLGIIPLKTDGSYWPTAIFCEHQPLIFQGKQLVIGEPQHSWLSTSHLNIHQDFRNHHSPPFDYWLVHRPGRTNAWRSTPW